MPARKKKPTYRQKPEYRAKMSEAMKGKRNAVGEHKMTPEGIEAIRQAQKRRRLREKRAKRGVRA